MSEPAQQQDADPLELAVYQAIAACSGDMRSAIKALTLCLGALGR